MFMGSNIIIIFLLEIESLYYRPFFKLFNKAGFDQSFLADPLPLVITIDAVS